MSMFLSTNTDAKSMEKVLAVRGHATSTRLGAGMDELLRHHPALKSPTIAAVIQIIQSQGKEIERIAPMNSTNASEVQKALIQDITDFASFLEVFFGSSHASDHIRSFCDNEGVKHLLSLYTLSYLLPDNPSAIHSLSVAFQPLSVQQPGLVFTSLLTQLQKELTEVDSHFGTPSAEHSEGITLVSNLKRIHDITVLLAVLVKGHHSNVRNAGNNTTPFSSLSEWTSVGSIVCFSLGKLQRRLICELAQRNRRGSAPSSSTSTTVSETTSSAVVSQAVSPIESEVII